MGRGKKKQPDAHATASAGGLAGLPQMPKPRDVLEWLYSPDTRELIEKMLNSEDSKDRSTVRNLFAETVVPKLRLGSSVKKGCGEEDEYEEPLRKARGVLEWLAGGSSDPDEGPLLSTPEDAEASLRWMLDRPVAGSNKAGLDEFCLLQQILHAGGLQQVMHAEPVLERLTGYVKTLKQASVSANTLGEPDVYKVPATQAARLADQLRSQLMSKKWRRHLRLARLSDSQRRQAVSRPPAPSPVRRTV